MKLNRTNVFFVLVLLLLILFLFWSKMLVYTFILLLILDSITYKWGRKWIKKRVPTFISEGLLFLNMIILPLFLAIFIRTFLVDYYFVPSSSMEHALFPKDYVIVNKLSYGPKVPRRITDLPILNSFFGDMERINKPYTKLAPMRRLKREDIVVFDAPLGDDPFLVKRIIGLPGDTVSIEDGVVFINGKKMHRLPKVTFDYRDTTLAKNAALKLLSNDRYDNLAEEEKMNLVKILIDRPGFEHLIFPGGKQNLWTIDNYGPLVVPQKGQVLTNQEIKNPAYAETIQNYELLSSGSDSLSMSTYTMQQDYYFVLGDNRHHSTDSRTLGFVPRNYVQGKMMGVVSVSRFKAIFSSE